MNSNKRHIHYINPAVQKRLMISLIVAELILICLTIFWLYIDLDQLIESNLYKIHIQNTLTTSFLMTRLSKSILILLAINIIIASIIVWYWKNYIKAITTPLEQITHAIQTLDFTIDPLISVPHESGAIAVEWLEREKNQLIKLRQCLKKLDDENQDSISRVLEECKKIIK